VSVGVRGIFISRRTSDPAPQMEPAMSDTIEPEWLSPSDWGKKFGYSRQKVYDLAAEGRITIRKFGPTKSLIAVADGRRLNNSLPAVTPRLPKKAVPA
jgi:hypothetical protein